MQLTKTYTTRPKTPNSPQKKNLYKWCFLSAENTLIWPGMTNTKTRQIHKQRQKTHSSDSLRTLQKTHERSRTCGAMDGVTGLESWVRWAPLCSPCKLHLSMRKVVGMVVCRNLRWMFIKVLVSAQYRVSDLWIPLTSSTVKIGFQIGNLCRFQHRWIT